MNELFEYKHDRAYILDDRTRRNRPQISMFL